MEEEVEIEEKGQVEMDGEVEEEVEGEEEGEEEGGVLLLRPYL